MKQKYDSVTAVPLHAIRLVMGGKNPTFWDPTPRFFRTYYKKHVFFVSSLPNPGVLWWCKKQPLFCRLLLTGCILLPPPPLFSETTPNCRFLRLPSALKQPYTNTTRYCTWTAVQCTAVHRSVLDSWEFSNNFLEKSTEQF